MDITCPYCGKSHPIDGPRDLGRSVESCPLCKARYELFYVTASKPPVAMRLRDLSRAPARAATAAAASSSSGAAPSSISRSAMRGPQTPPPARPPHRRPRPGTSDPLASSPLKPGESVGGYRILSLLGKGGMGLVFRAEQLSLRRDVALKVLAPHLAEQPNLVLRFMREAYAAAQLTHHHLVQIYDVGAAGVLRFFSMEFVNGMTLSELIQTRGALSPREAATYTLQAARGLRFAHDHGLVHRDVKPSNLLLSQDGLVKVVDLGVVLATDARLRKRAFKGVDPADDFSEQQFLGTPGYAAPEQAERGDQADARSDVYSLGCTLYALLSGRPPFTGRDADELAHAHRTRPPASPSDVNPAIDADLSGITLKMIAKRPDERYQSMSDVVDALESYLGTGAATADGQPATALVTPDEASQLAKAAKTLRESQQWPLARAASLAALATACVTTGVLMVSLNRHNAVAAATPGAHTTSVAPFSYAFVITLLSLLFYAVARARRSQHPLASLVRNLFDPSDALDLTSYKVLVPLALVLIVEYLSGWLLPVAAVLGVAGGLALALHGAADAAVDAAIKPAVDQTNVALQSMRSRGLDETEVRAALLKHAGPQWRPLSEASLGYAAALAMGQTAPATAGGKRAGDAIAAWVLRHAAERLDRRQIKLLTAQETQVRVRLGAGLAEAQAEAERSAGKLRDRARAVRQAAYDDAIDELNTRFQFVTDESGQPAARPPRGPAKSSAAFRPDDLWTALDDEALDAALSAPAKTPSKKKRPAAADADEEESDTEEETDSPFKKPKRKSKRKPAEDQETGLEGYVRQSYFERRFGTPLDVLLGPSTRILLAFLVLAFFAAWSRLNKGGTFANAVFGGPTADALKPLRIAWLPNALCDLLASYNGAAAGVILMLSLMGKGRRFAALVLLAAASAVFTPHIVSVLHLPHFASPVITGALCLAALLSRDMQE